MHGGRMNAAVDEEFGDVHDSYAAIKDVAGDGDEFVGAGIGRHRLVCFWAKGQGVNVLDALGDVIGAEDRGLRDVAQAGVSKGPDIRVSANQDIELTPVGPHFADGFWAIVIPGITFAALD